MIRITHALSMNSPLGAIRLAAAGDALAGIWLEEHETRPDLSAASEGERHALLRDACAQLAAYFAGARVAFDLPLAPQGTPFQRRVWETLREIPLGETWSYAALARRAGHPRAIRAAGAANGRNPISIVVPCHRVVGADGSLTGYAGGLAAKRWLLEHEARVARVTGQAVVR